MAKADGTTHRILLVLVWVQEHSEDTDVVLGQVWPLLRAFLNQAACPKNHHTITTNHHTNNIRPKEARRQGVRAGNRSEAGRPGKATRPTLGVEEPFNLTSSNGDDAKLQWHNANAA